jgi:hypothetical protein
LLAAVASKPEGELGSALDRIIQGMISPINCKPIANPGSWLFG